MRFVEIAPQHGLVTASVSALIRLPFYPPRMIWNRPNPPGSYRILEESVSFSARAFGMITGVVRYRRMVIRSCTLPSPIEEWRVRLLFRGADRPRAQRAPSAERPMGLDERFDPPLVGPSAHRTR
jgi:hypothetical protein